MPRRIPTFSTKGQKAATSGDRAVRALLRLREGRWGRASSGRVAAPAHAILAGLCFILAIEAITQHAWAIAAVALFVAAVAAAYRRPTR